MAVSYKALLLFLPLDAVLLPPVLAVFEALIDASVVEVIVLIFIDVSVPALAVAEVSWYQLDVLLQLPFEASMPSKVQVPFKLVSRVDLYAQSRFAFVKFAEALAALVIVSARLTFTFEIPGPAGGVAAFLELLQNAKNKHSGNTKIVFFILTVLYRKNHNRAKNRVEGKNSKKSIMKRLLRLQE